MEGESCAFLHWRDHIIYNLILLGNPSGSLRRSWNTLQGKKSVWTGLLSLLSLESMSWLSRLTRILIEELQLKKCTDQDSLQWGKLTCQWSLVEIITASAIIYCNLASGICCSSENWSIKTAMSIKSEHKTFPFTKIYQKILEHWWMLAVFERHVVMYKGSHRDALLPR